MFSPNLKSHAIILRHYGRWGDIEAANQSALGYSTSDGSYAIYVPLGQMRAAESKSAIFYYAAPRRRSFKRGKRLAGRLDPGAEAGEIAAPRLRVQSSWGN